MSDPSAHVPPDTDTAATPAGTSRLVVTGGGTPSDAELAALVVVLTPPGAAAPGPTVAAWRRAALLEGVGGASVLAPSDLDVRNL